MFYSLDQRRTDKPRFVRREECLQCHASPKTLGVPGHLVRSVYPDAEGLPLLQAGSFQTDHTSPFRERWGGWYVTGTHGVMRHMGNTWVRDPGSPDQLDVETGANVTRLSDRVNLSRYARPDSDLVALMVLEHQTRLHNLLTRANWETRIALRQQEDMNRTLGQPSDHWFDSTRRRSHSHVEDLLKYMLFTEKVRLEAAVAGTSGFQDEFPKTGPRDRHGRSLRDLDLKTRLFRLSFQLSDLFRSVCGITAGSTGSPVSVLARCAHRKGAEPGVREPFQCRPHRDSRDSAGYEIRFAGLLEGDP